MATKVTHFRNVSGIEAVYVGPKGSEVKIADTTAAVFRGAAGAEYSVSDKDMNVVWLAGSTSAATSVSFAVPYNVSIAACRHVIADATVAVPSASHGTVVLGSAGVIMTACQPVSTGGGDIVTLYTTTSNTVTASAGQVLKLSLLACGTAMQQSVVLTLTRTGN